MFLCILNNQTHIQWPERIPGGSRITEVTSLLDLVPTIAQLVSDQTATNPRDGVSLLEDQGWRREGGRERTIFHFCDSEIFAVRRQMEDGKVYKMILQEPTLTQSGGCPGHITHFKLTF